VGRQKFGNWHKRKAVFCHNIKENKALKWPKRQKIILVQSGFIKSSLFEYGEESTFFHILAAV
jgi:hypothetical protein